MKELWRKRKIKHYDIAKFNYEIDTNSDLKKELDHLACSYLKLNEKEYQKRMIKIFRKYGIYLNTKELNILLCIRQQMDQMMLEVQMNDKNGEHN